MGRLIRRLNLEEFFVAYPSFCRARMCPAGWSCRFQGFIAGTFFYAGKELYIDSEVDILIPPRYPLEPPRIYISEKGVRMNLGPEGHFMSDGSICLGLSTEEIELLRKDCSLKNLLDSLVLNYVCGLEYWRIFGRYPFETRAHGRKGWMEYFQEQGLDDDSEIAILFSLLDMSHRKANKISCPFCHSDRYGKCQCKGNVRDWQLRLPKRTREFLRSNYHIGIVGDKGHHESNKGINNEQKKI